MGVPRSRIAVAGPGHLTREAPLGAVTLASGWSRTVDDGERADVSCTEDGFALLAQQQAG